jgi:hypothetical protein
MITGGEAAGDHPANMQDIIKDLEELPVPIEPKPLTNRYRSAL